MADDKFLEINSALSKLIFDSLSLNTEEDIMHKVYLFLKNYFPIVGIQFFRFSKELNVVQNDFLILDSGHAFTEKIYTFNEEEIEIALREQEGREILLGTIYNQPGTIPEKILDAYSPYLKPIDRAIMQTTLWSQGSLIWNICLIGEDASCFTAEHGNLFLKIKPVLSKFHFNLYDYNEMRKLTLNLKGENEKLVNELNFLKQNTIISSNKEMLKTLKTVEHFVPSNATILITGETGTGKEVIADLIQAKSQERSKGKAQSPYVKINCGAIPESLIESELFGHQKGTFTGAISDKMGKFEEADNGILFLDEIGELSLESQVRLLRVLQDGIVQRLGSSKPIKVNVRVIAATNRNLEEMVKEGTFRQDLYFRLNILPLYLLPLRERKEDIPLLVKHFIEIFRTKLNINHAIEISNESMKELQAQYWEGNVRELKNLIERAITLNPASPLNISEHLASKNVLHAKEYREIHTNSDEFALKDFIQKEIKQALEDRNSSIQTDMSEELELDKVIANHIVKVLKLCHYKINGKGGAAEMLNINPSTLRKKMAKLNIKLSQVI